MIARCRANSYMLNGLVIGASVALTIGALELLARVARNRPSEPAAARYTQYDPILGWRHRPEARVDFASGAYLINSHGLRDKERDYTPGSGVERLLVLGDSFAEGFSVPFEDSVSQALEHRLDRPHCRYEVINGGTVGYSTDQEYLFYREEGRRYQAHIVVLFLYYNDVLYNGRDGVGGTPKPLFTFRGGTPRVKNYPLPRVEPFRNLPGVASSRRRSAALEWLAARLKSGAPRAYNALATIGLWPRLRRESPPLELDIYSREPPRPITDAWAFTDHLLRALNAEVRDQGGRLLVAYVPSKMEVSKRDWELTLFRYGMDENRWDRRRLSRLLQELGVAAGFPVLDLSEALREKGAYHAQGGHWNAHGHGIAAEGVERFLRHEGWLAACAG